MTEILAILGAFALVTFAPGPANLAVSVTAMSRGEGPATRMALGLALGLAFWGVLAAMGLGAVLAASETAMGVLRVLGGLYLLVLCVSGFRAMGPDLTARAAEAAMFRSGLLLNLSNPKAVLAWLAALSMGLGPASGAGTLVLVTALCAGIGLANYLLWALLMSRGRVRAAYGRARRAVDATVAALFGLAGGELIRQAVTR